MPTLLLPTLPSVSRRSTVTSSESSYASGPSKAMDFRAASVAVSSRATHGPRRTVRQAVGDSFCGLDPAGLPEGDAAWPTFVLRVHPNKGVGLAVPDVLDTALSLGWDKAARRGGSGFGSVAVLLGLRPSLNAFVMTAMRDSSSCSAVLPGLKCPCRGWSWGSVAVLGIASGNLYVVHDGLTFAAGTTGFALNPALEDDRFVSDGALLCFPSDLPVFDSC